MSGNEQQLSVNELSEGKEYEFRVTASTSAGEGKATKRLQGSTSSSGRFVVKPCFHNSGLIAIRRMNDFVKPRSYSSD